MAKSLGADAPLEQTTEKSSPVNFKRVINGGVEVDLSFGPCVVKEMAGADFLCFLLDAVETVQVFLKQEGDGLQALRSLIQDKTARKNLEKFFVLSIGRDSSEEISFTVSDYVVLMSACKQVYDWETIQKGFTELGLLEMLQQTFLSSSNSDQTTD